MPKRFSITFTDKSVEALDVITATEDVHQGDAVNRAVQVWAFLLLEQAAGRKILLRDEDGNTEVVKIV